MAPLPPAVPATRTGVRAGAGRGALRELVAVLIILAVGAGSTLLLSSRTWQSIAVPRARPLSDVLVDATGRRLSGALVGLAVVALAAIAAVLATRGWLRRVVGAVVVLDGLGLMLVSLRQVPAVSTARALDLVADAHAGVSALSPDVRVATHPQWALLSAVAGLLIALGGVAIAWRGHRWNEMSRRYEAPVRGARPAAAPGGPAGGEGAADSRLWDALDRGDDPTGDDPTGEDLPGDDPAGDNPTASGTGAPGAGR